MKGKTGIREQLFQLVAEAAEVEHTLMCSYLYVAFSLKSSDRPEFSPDERDAVRRWRKVVLGVAIDEMSHLLIVANLGVALGGRPHFARPNFPVSPGYFPSGVSVKLSPFCEETLDHLIYLERPRGVAGSDAPGFQDVTYRREEAYDGLMPSIMDYRTVGELYESLKATLATAASALGESDLFIGPRSSQVAGKNLGFGGVRPIADLRDALEQIDAIVEQGEGSPGGREDSHYRHFQEVRVELDRLKQRNPAFTPAWPAATNPVMRRPPEPEDKVFVTDPKSARVLDFANAVYGQILRLLVQCFGRRTPDAADEQASLMEAALHLMHSLGRVASLLPTLPAGEGSGGSHAGMTFTMLRGIEPLLHGDAERRLLEERWAELLSEARRLEADDRSLVGLVDEVAGSRVHSPARSA